MSNNIILLLFLLVVLAIIVYFCYTNMRNQGVPKGENGLFNKKVRFDNHVRYINSGPHVRTDSEPRSNSDSHINSELTGSSQSISLSDSDHLSIPNSLDKDIEPRWDSAFGAPLMSAAEKKKFTDSIKKDHKQYERSLGKFSQYLMDKSTVIEPFKPNTKSSKLKGRPIQDIYNEQVAGPKAKPKQIKRKTDTMIVYDDETEMNGGSLGGTDVNAFDENFASHKLAAFGNEF